MCVCPLWQALGLWVIFSVHVGSEEGDYESLKNFSQQCSNTDLSYQQGISLFLTNGNGIMEHKDSTYIVEHPDYSIEEDIPALLDVFSGRLPLNISCIVDMQNHLNFSWDTSGVPEHAQYSISYLLCSDTEPEKGLVSHKEDVPAPVYSTVLGNQVPQDHIILRLNVNFPGIWYIQTQKWDIRRVEKLDPPQFINTTIQSDQLYLEWDLPKSKSRTENPSCFSYELRINDEVRNLSQKLSHSEPNIDQTRTYKIQMRVKMLDACHGSLYWSDWTSILNLGPLILQPDFHIGVMVTIALGLPMSLLAILLLCKFRIFYKLFPPIPGPSIKIKGLLEKDITSQVLYQIISHKCVEEVSEVEVKEDEEEEDDEDENEEERL